MLNIIYCFRALQEENADLHQNLLQTVVCIESLEAELQQTRDELIHVKEKYKRLVFITRTNQVKVNNHSVSYKGHGKRYSTCGVY